MDFYIGQIIMFGGNFAIRNFAFCDGQLLSIANNTALFSILGTTFGGDGRTTFALPDLRGRFPMHPGHGPGLTPRKLGEAGGSETNTLNITQMPNHNHPVGGEVTVHVADAASDSFAANNDALGATTGNRELIYANNPQFNAGNKLAGVTQNLVTGNVGGNLPVNNIPPYQCINFLICMYGIFPPRS